MNKPYFMIPVLLILLLAGTAFAQSDIDQHRDCVHCGMDRKAFGYSRMLVRYEDGSEAGLCSIRCAAVELDANKSRKVKAILVADRDSRALIDAEKAVWVLGGAKKGVMTMLPKWAFESKTSAEKFVKEHRGSIVSWTDAFEAARKELSH